MPFRYAAHGLVLASVLSLPAPAAGDGEPDVIIRVDGASPPAAPTGGSCRHDSPAETVLSWPDVGVVTIRQGREITLAPVSGADERVLQLAVLGPVMAALLRQRGCLVLHASAVAVAGAACAFLGESGSGKSTTAAALYARGHAVLADDVAAVDVGRSMPTVAPGFHQLKLWPDAATALAFRPETLPVLHPRLDKRGLSVHQAFPRSPVPLRRLYVLAAGEAWPPEPLRPQEAFIELVRHTYGVRFFTATPSSAHFQQCAALARLVPMRRLQPGRALAALPELAARVEEDLARGA